MRTALIAHGEILNPKYILQSIDTYDQIIAIDGGLSYCSLLNIQPHLIIGDEDSTPPHLLEHYAGTPKLTFPTYKDKTDLEIAIEHAFSASTHLTVFGALGNRADHTLYNLILLTRHAGKVVFESEWEKVWAIPHHLRLTTYPGQHLSFLPLNGPVSGINSQGLRWELKEATFHPHFMSISNEALGNQIELSFKTGDLLCFLQKN